MRKIKFSLGIGLPLTKQEEVFEYDDDTTDDEIENDFMAWVDSWLGAEWWEKK